MRPPLKQRELTCLNKRRFADEYVARIVAQETLLHPDSTVSRLWVYPCPECKGWHLTSRHKSNKSKVTVEEIWQKTDQEI